MTVALPKNDRKDPKQSPWKVDVIGECT